MAVQYLVLSGTTPEEVEAAFSSLNASLGSLLGYPKNNIEIYGHAIEHPTLDQLAMPILDEALAVLTPAQISNLQSQDQLTAQGFHFSPPTGPLGDVDQPGWFAQFKGWLGI